MSKCFKKVYVKPQECKTFDASKGQKTTVNTKIHNSYWKKEEIGWNVYMAWTFNITKTFEPNQKSVRGSLDLLVVHPNFWGELPAEYTQRKYIAGILRSWGSIKIQVPGYAEFYIKPIEFGDTRNGSYMLCWVLANTRQGGGVAGAHLIDPDEVAAGKLNLLRNSDRHTIRSFVVHFAETKPIVSKGSTIKNLLNKEIPALSILDTEIHPMAFLNKEIPALSILDKKIF